MIKIDQKSSRHFIIKQSKHLSNRITFINFLAMILKLNTSQEKRTFMLMPFQMISYGLV